MLAIEMTWLLPLLLGLVIGTVMGLTGAGGGVLAVPLLVYAMGLEMQVATPIALLAVGLAALLGTSLGLWAGQVRYKAALLMGTVGLSASPLGFWVAGRSNGQVLSALFAFVLMWVAFNAFRHRANTALAELDAPQAGPVSPCPCMLNPDTGRFVWTWPCARALIGSGGLAGLMSGLLGVGGGFVLVPALQRFTNIHQQSVTVTSLAVIAVVSLSGVVNSAMSGTFQVHTGLTFSLGAMLGMLLGRQLGKHLPTHVLKWSFGGICLVVSALMIIRAAG
ncbi:sulfite exporter TauE/SafE family protein [Limnobacter sp.]|uniref:sulfite exporter TauE/SafE family protein n=1 Tax=Limnobacter sp. TaxID=2003368 RepID=UPI0035171FC9